MREIKFRAWIPDKKVMTTGHSFIKWQKMHEVAPPEVLMQYTSLKDRNGVEIYEGDILLVQWPSDGEDWEAAEVVWWDTGFVLLYDGVFYHLHHQEFTNDMRWSDVWDDPETMITEVIGNIYETPELVK